MFYEDKGIENNRKQQVFAYKKQQYFERKFPDGLCASAIKSVKKPKTLPCRLIIS